MKYKKISFSNHPILGTLSLDLVNPKTGDPYQNVILVGDNGIGKTVLLQFLSTFNPQMHMENIGAAHMEIEMSDEDVQRVFTQYRNSPFNPFQAEDLTARLLSLDYDSTKEQSPNCEGEITNILGGKKKTHGATFSSIFRSIFSRAEISFSPHPISSVTSQEIDQEELKQRQSTENLSTEIKQLFIDINTQDAVECQEWVDAHVGVVPPDLVKHRRLKRFTKAFDNMFPTKRLLRVSSHRGNIDVLFEENGRQMSIDNLSSGEKEIVFRGAFLLRDKQSVSGCVALVDEPELSMHPKWEMKILDYYKDLFRNEQNQQQCQLFIATHSVYVLKAALESSSDSLVVVLNRDAHGSVQCNSVTAPNKLSTITSAETSYLAFGIYSIDYHIELFSEYQSRINVSSIKKVDQAIMATPEYNSNLANNHKHSDYRDANGQLVCSYETVCCLVRNHIDHPATSAPYTEEDLVNSIELLRSLL